MTALISRTVRSPLGALAVLAVLVFGAVIVTGQNAAVTINVDVSTNRRPINPLIYGVAHATDAELAVLNTPLHRFGGNHTSRYNWQINAFNRASDWYFESVGEPSAVAGDSADAFVARSQAAGAQPMLTIPVLDWVARLGNSRSRLASFSIAKYGSQTGNDAQWFPDAGNGIRTAGGYVTGNDPTDANTPSSPVFQQAWVQHLVSRWGGAASGGPPYYVMDNEPSSWFLTHRDVHPTGATMNEVRVRVIDYASMVKAVDPAALIVGPEEWGWTGYLYSGYDQQWARANGWGGTMPDRAAHGGWDYLPWLLDQWRQHNAATGGRVLDVFSVHYYPQGGEYSSTTTSTMQLLRNRSTRSLWDPDYVDESWIRAKVQLIPRLRNWVNTYYAAGTPIAITEYSWGAEAHISGAMAQADVLGIFGREGLDMAARWATPDATTPTFKAMRMYRNYDGNGSTFGDTSVSATGPNPDNVAVFAAERSRDGALTVMVLNKYLSGDTPVTVNLSGFTHAGSAERWHLTSANAIVRLADVGLAGNALSASLPAQSVTLFVIPSAGQSQGPTAVIDATPTTGVVPLTATFDGSRSSDPVGTIRSYAWTFGDGTSGSGARVMHTYTAPGSYSATLTVTNDRGGSAAQTVLITVSPDPDVIKEPSSLTASVSSGRVTLRWTDSSTNETGFHVERTPFKQNAWTRVGTVGANLTTFSETASRGTYDYRVQAFNATTGRTSGYSNVARVRVR